MKNVLKQKISGGSQIELDFLNTHRRELTIWQLSFYEGCRKYYAKNKKLSDKQLSTLKDLAKHIENAN